MIGALCLVGAEAVDPEPTKGGLLDRDVSAQEDDAEVKVPSTTAPVSGAIGLICGLAFTDTEPLKIAMHARLVGADPTIAPVRSPTCCGCRVVFWLFSCL